MSYSSIKGMVGLFDSHEPVSLQMHRVYVPRKRMRTAEWMYKDEEVRAFLLKCFPQLESNDQQRRQAGRWLYIIRNYFCNKASAPEIAEQRGLTTRAVNRIVQRIRLVDAGRRQDGKPRTGRAKGRPRKSQRTLN